MDFRAVCTIRRVERWIPGQARDDGVFSCVYSLSRLFQALDALGPPRGGARLRATLALRHVLTPKRCHSFFVKAVVSNQACDYSATYFPSPSSWSWLTEFFRRFSRSNFLAFVLILHEVSKSLSEQLMLTPSG